MGTAQELDQVRRELRDVTLPARLASFAGGKAVLFDDRVEIDRVVIALAPGQILTDVVVTGSGRSGVVYLSVSGPDGNRSLRLKADEEAGAREFAAAVRLAADRVLDVQAERDRRIQELGTRVAELTGDGRAGTGREPLLVGDVLAGAPGPQPADPLVDDVPDPEGWPSRAERAAARQAGVVGSGRDAVHVVTGVPGPFTAEGEAGAAGAPASRREGRGRREKVPKPPKAGKAPRTPKATKPPKPPKAARAPKAPKPPRAAKPLRFRKRPLAALLGVLLVVGGTAGAVQLLRDHDVSMPSGAGSPAPPDPGPAPPSAGKPAASGKPEARGTADRSMVARATAALRKRLGRADVDVIDVDVDRGTLTVDVRQTDPGGMARQTGEVFADIHASGLDPATAVLQHHGMIRDPVTGRTELGVVGVYEMSREESESIDWAAWGDISWDNFLTYREDDWP